MRNFINLTGTQTIDDIISKLIIGDIYYIRNTNNIFIYQYVILPKKKEYVGQPYTRDNGIIVMRPLDNIEFIPKVKLTFTANTNTTVNVFFTKNSYDNSKPDDTISLIANQEKPTTYFNKDSIYKFTFDDPSVITSAKIDGALLNCSFLFSECYSLISLDVTKLDTSNVTDMGAMFGKCTELTSLDISHFNTSNVTDMDSIFADCSKLTILDLSNWDTSKVTNMNAMFDWCESLTSLDLSHFNTSKVTNMNSMFNCCSKLTTIGPVDKASGWQHKPDNYTNMFTNCPATPKPSWYK